MRTAACLNLVIAFWTSGAVGTGEVLRKDTTFRPGRVLKEALVIGADGIVIDGNGAVLEGPGRAGDKRSFTGVGLLLEGRRNVTLRNLTVRGFEIGLAARDCRNLTVENCDFSDNYHDPEHGWGDGERNGGIILTRVSESSFRENRANRVWNGIDLFECDDNLIEKNDFSHCSNVCLKLWKSCRNQVRDNDLSYGLRIKPGEVHARDSTCVLIETGSNDNLFERNDVTHGGDGIFIRPLNGWMSTGNSFIENDCSYANNNGFESWSPGNVFLRNKANHCSYGFWLGWSDRSVLIGNEAGWNGLPDGFHNAPESDFRHGGIVIVHGSGTHGLIQDNWCHDNNGGGIVLRGDLGSRGGRWKMEHLVIQGNRLENNQWGLFTRFADRLFLAGNQYEGNEEDEHFEDVTRILRGDGGPGPAPEVSIEGPERVVTGEPARFVARPSGARQSSEPLEFWWDLDGREVREAVIEHVFEAPGYQRVSLTASDGQMGALDGLDVYVVRQDDRLSAELGTEAGDGGGRFGAELLGDAEGRAQVRFEEDPECVVGRNSVKVRLDPYHGGEFNVVFPASRDASWDLSDRVSLSFWLRFRNPNNGFQGPAIVRLHSGPKMMTYVPTRGGRPIHWFRDFPYAEARSGWQRVEVPLGGGEGWMRSLGSAGEVPPHADGSLLFETVSTSVETQDASALASDGKRLYCASLEGDRLFASDDGRAFLPLKSPREDLGGRGDWINGMLAFSRRGPEGSLILRHRDPEPDEFGVEWSRLVVYDIAKGRWSWLPTRLAAGHGSVVLGRHLFAIAHAIMGNYGGPIARVDLSKPPAQAERTTLEGVKGENSGWLSRAAQLAEVGGRIYGIKNDWITPQPLAAGENGDRLFVFDPKQFQVSRFKGGEPWDAAHWEAAYTPVEDLGPLPFEVGHGAALVGLPPRWSSRIGAEGGLFVLAGCSPSNHEGQGSPSDRYALYDIESGQFSPGRLPDATGTGSSAVLHQGRLYIKRGGLNFPAFNGQLWIASPIPPERAAALLSEQARRKPEFDRADSVSIQFDSNGHQPFEIWIDGLRFERRDQ